MYQGLHDFQIENDSVILLSFIDGTRQRVAPKDLKRYLSPADMSKVQEAMRLRKQFMRRVLPPTAMMVLVVLIGGLGFYDVSRMTQPLSSGAPAASRNGAAPAWLPSLAPVRPSPVKTTMPIRPARAQNETVTEPLSVAAPSTVTPATPSAVGGTPSVAAPVRRGAIVSRAPQAAPAAATKTVHHVADTVLDPVVPLLSPLTKLLH